MKNGDIKLVSSESNAIHIIKLIDSSLLEKKSLRR